MNLLCPNCQKMLTVPEEFAGQLMKCPMCSGTFTVPGLPGTPPPSGPPEPDVFSVRHDAPPPAPPPVPNREPPPPKPAPPPSTPSAPSLPPEGYQHTAAVWFSPRVLPWVAPVCLLLVFLLQFFNWAGLYPGNVPAVTQNAWQAAFGLSTVDPDMKKAPDPLYDFAPIDDEKYKPGVSVLTIFYLLLFFPVLVVTVASVVIGLVPVKIPPAVEQFLPWRWLVVAAANLILFLFLALQLLLGFSLDNRYTEWVDKQVENKATKTTQEQKTDAANHGIRMEALSHRFPLHLAVTLHLIAVVSAALMFWVSKRGTHRPLPRVELAW